MNRCALGHPHRAASPRQKRVHSGRRADCGILWPPCGVVKPPKKRCKGLLADYRTRFPAFFGCYDAREVAGSTLVQFHARSRCANLVTVTSETAYQKSCLAETRSSRPTVEWAMFYAGALGVCGSRRTGVMHGRTGSDNRWSPCTSSLGRFAAASSGRRGRRRRAKCPRDVGRDVCCRIPVVRSHLSGSDKPARLQKRRPLAARARACCGDVGRAMRVPVSGLAHYPRSGVGGNVRHHWASLLATERPLYQHFIASGWPPQAMTAVCRGEVHVREEGSVGRVSFSQGETTGREFPCGGATTCPASLDRH